MMPILAEWARQPGKVAIVREPPAQHFPGGAYNPAGSTFVTPYLGCCPQLSDAAAFDNFNWRAVESLRREADRHPNVHILPWYNATLRRYGAHVGTGPGCFSPKSVVVRGGSKMVWARKKECGCDCTHYCYTPLFYDAAFFTPLYEALRARGAP